MLLPLRRYRLFVVVAFFLVFIFYILRGASDNPRLAPSSPAANVHLNDHAGSPAQPISGANRPGHASFDVKSDTHVTPDDKLDAFPQIKLPGAEDQVATPQGSLKYPEPPSWPETVPQYNPGQLKDDIFVQDIAENAAGGAIAATTTRPLHWTKRKEHYPVPSTAIIHLPTGKPKHIPPIQARVHQRQSGAAQNDRLRQVKDVFLKHWRGYEEYAWEHDELKPVSGGFADPFAGWRATLVDSLDTLWIMGLKDDFSKAVNATMAIDFTTTSRGTLPLFEVVIRYLGGLLGGYDVSLHQYPILLDKAEELAEVLMGAFDTPNRMPLTQYDWRPAAAKEPQRAPVQVVLAEIGSLSLEFTRLAQLTGRQKYYDAVARITNELEAMQDNTTLPGLWPLTLDASGGCDFSSILLKHHSLMNGPSGLSNGAAGSHLMHSGAARSNLQAFDPHVSGDSEYHRAQIGELGEREVQPGYIPSSTRTAVDNVRGPANEPIDKCVTTGLRGSVGMQGSKYSLGGMADSVYEYLPKEHLLLGGLNDQYRKMHELSTKTWKEYLLFRPMIEDEKRKILFAGDWMASGHQNETTGRDTGKFRPSTGHLDCFLGAYVGLAAKAFGIEEDMELATQLTDACVWAYEVTPTGIMPEGFDAVPCPDMTGQCPWNELVWWDAVDPLAESKVASNIRLHEMADQPPPPLPKLTEINEITGPAPKTPAKPVEKRQLASREVPHPPDNSNSFHASKTVKDQSPRNIADTVSADPKTLPRLRTPSDGQNHILPKIKSDGSSHTDYKPLDFSAPMTRAEMMELTLSVTPVPPGMARIASREYMLRPEAIESVFYMWRLTGDPIWREKGWAMFEAIDNATSAEFGNSAIRNVMSEESSLKNAAESFWTAETLKYFYLLFSDTELVSLDDYVLNTEAHPFLRPDAKLG